MLFFWFVVKPSDLQMGKKCKCKRFIPVPGPRGPPGSSGSSFPTSTSPVLTIDSTSADIEPNVLSFYRTPTVNGLFYTGVFTLRNKTGSAKGTSITVSFTESQSFLVKNFGFPLVDLPFPANFTQPTNATQSGTSVSFTTLNINVAGNATKTLSFQFFAPTS